MEETNTESKEVAKIEIAKEGNIVGSSSTNVFASKDMFELVQRQATMFSKSDLVPKQFQNNIPNCIIALEMAGRIGASPLMIMQHLYIVHGKPSWSSTFLIATVNACGRFTSLKFDKDEKTDGGRTRAYATEKSTGEVLYGEWVSMNMAKSEGWIDKAGSKWKTMAMQMMSYRAATFWTRLYAPELSMGIRPIDEIEDIGFEEVKTQKEDAVKAIFEVKETPTPESTETKKPKKGEQTSII